MNFIPRSVKPNSKLSTPLLASTNRQRPQARLEGDEQRPSVGLDFELLKKTKEAIFNEVVSPQAEKETTGVLETEIVAQVGDAERAPMKIRTRLARSIVEFVLAQRPSRNRLYELGRMSFRFDLAIDEETNESGFGGEPVPQSIVRTDEQLSRLKSQGSYSAENADHFRMAQMLAATFERRRLALERENEQKKLIDSLVVAKKKEVADQEMIATVVIPDGPEEDDLFPDIGKDYVVTVKSKPTLEQPLKEQEATRKSEFFQEYGKYKPVEIPILGKDKPVAGLQLEEENYTVEDGYAEMMDVIYDEADEDDEQLLQEQRERWEVLREEEKEAASRRFAQNRRGGRGRGRGSNLGNELKQINQIMKRKYNEEIADADGKKKPK